LPVGHLGIRHPKTGITAEAERLRVDIGVEVVRELPWAKVRRRCWSHQHQPYHSRRSLLDGCERACILERASREGAAVKKFLRSVAGLHVAFTGRVGPWDRQSALVRDLRKRGADVRDDGELNDRTSVLIRGASRNWKHSKFGTKEACAAERLRRGQALIVVTSTALSALFRRGTAARRREEVAGQPVEWLVPASEAAFLSVSRIPGPLDREYTHKGRVEQSYLRKLLLGKETSARCQMCGETLPSDLLVAAHVKPRSECSAQERRDAKNIVFLLCMLGCDALYERGYVSVDDRGRYVVADRKLFSAHLASRLPSGRMVCRAWTAGSEPYFTWHRENRFSVRTR
jgi:hypothetical protein